MSTQNPYLKNTERAPYELPALLKSLGLVDVT
jgi:hypothetical protein